MKAVAIPKVEGVPAVPVKLPVRKRVDLPAIAVPAVVVPTVPGLPETPALPDVSKVVGLVKVPRGIAEPKVAGVPAVDTTTGM